MKRSIWLVGGVVTLVLLFAGAAFVGGRLLAATELTSDKQHQVMSGSGDTKSGRGVVVDVKPAAEMPDSSADVSGLFVRREDNSLFVGTGNLSGVLVDGKWEQHYDGPVVELVTTHDTRIYRDDLLQKLDGVAPSGQVQQILEPGSVDEIGENSFVEAWGQRRGDRLVAEVVVFKPNP